MNQGLMRSPTRLAIVLLAMSTGVAGAAPTPKKPPPPKGKAASVCGVKIIPLVVGNEWTYEPVTLASVVVDDSIKKFVPTEPRKIVIKVVSVDAPPKAGGDTTVNLEETTTWDISKDTKPKLVDRTIKTTIVCNTKKFDVDPSSFFFAGEPGGAYDLAFDKVERPKGTSFALVNGAIGEAPWGEDLVAHFTRSAHANTNAKLLGGKLELERRFTPGTPENMNVKLGGPYRAEKLQLKITGRVTLEGGIEELPPDWTSNDKTCSVVTGGFKCDLPANWVTLIWLTNDVGILRMQNTYAHVFDLSDAKLQ
jgi:hypothetical protein